MARRWTTAAVAQGYVSPENADWLEKHVAKAIRQALDKAKLEELLMEL